jgi:hypothetical protein
MTRLTLVLLFAMANAMASAIAAPLSAQAGGQGNVDVPQGHRPPPGMCRIWIDGVPATRQPAPTDCATAIRRRPQNARVVFGAELRAPRDERDLQGDQRGRDRAEPERQADRADAVRRDADRRDADRRPPEPRQGDRPAPAAKPDDRGRAQPREQKPQHPRTALPRPRAEKPPHSFRRFER